ncbi:hypothetical protein ACIF85_35715 [Streptomyces sp. NPDC086033]|uniref:hypothetical protein n=1 Tax=Streptomyces sp. NPDC086033 TaxID=3365747 RepID=UPI0037D536E0
MTSERQHRGKVGEDIERGTRMRHDGSLARVAEELHVARNTTQEDRLETVLIVAALLDSRASDEQ